MRVREVFKKIDVKRPSDLIITQIKDLVEASQLKPGDRLPSENDMARSFGVSRNQVREAMKKLEVYGIVHTIPQKGSFISTMGTKTLDGIFSNLLVSGSFNYKSLIDTRLLLECRAVELASARIRDEEIFELERVHRLFTDTRGKGQPGFDEDMSFHLKIAEFSGSPVLTALITLLIKDVVPLIKDFYFSEGGFGTDKDRTLTDHRAVVDALIAKNTSRAVEEMKAHLLRPRLVEWATIKDAG